VAVAGGPFGPPPPPPGGPVPLVSLAPRPSSFDTAFVLGTGSTADATYGNHDLAAVCGNMQTATATGANHSIDIVTPSGIAGGAAGMLVPKVAAAPVLSGPMGVLEDIRNQLATFIADPVPNVAVSAFGHPLVQLGTAHATPGLGLAVAVGANSDATAQGIFNSAFALGGGSDARVIAYLPFTTCEFDTAIAVGTNDLASAGGSLSVEWMAPGSFDTAFVLGNGLTAYAGGANGLVDIVTPFGAL
jgi:hypothetical protein